MQSYWDLTEKERSDLTQEQVQGFLDVELMSKGVLKVLVPEMEPVEEVSVPMTEYYQVKAGNYSSEFSGFAFKSIEDAEAFARMAVMDIDSDYTTKVKTAKAFDEPLSIVPVQLANETDKAAHKEALQRRAAAQKRNDDKRSEYSKAQGEVDKVLAGVWNDWHRCRSLVSDHQRVIDTRNEYLRLCDSDPKVADRFLAKAFEPEQIKAAFEWFGIEAPEQPMDLVEADSCGSYAAEINTVF